MEELSFTGTFNSVTFASKICLKEKLKKELKNEIYNEIKEELIILIRLNIDSILKIERERIYSNIYNELYEKLSEDMKKKGDIWILEN